MKCERCGLVSNDKKRFFYFTYSCESNLDQLLLDNVYGEGASLLICESCYQNFLRWLERN